MGGGAEGDRRIPGALVAQDVDLPYPCQPGPLDRRTERRTVPVDPESATAVDRRRFDAGGSWTDPPAHWSEAVDERLSTEPLVAEVWASIARLPEGQRAVVTLRDVDGLSSKEVCDVLGISEANQRVLLHRGRSRIRADFEVEVAEL